MATNTFTFGRTLKLGGSEYSRYAFVTIEGVGAEPGAVDVIDLASRTKVASVDVGQQAGGIASLEGSAADPARIGSPP